MPKLGAKPIFISVTGGVFMYSGFKGLTISETLRELVSGRNPADLAAQKFPDITGLHFGPQGQDLTDLPSSTIVHSPGHPHGKGARYISPANIYRYARQAGFSATGAVVMTAVALAESSGNANAHCLNCVPGVKEDSRGLTQVNVDAHPWAAQSDLYDPATNLAAAYEISSHGKNFNPWTTFTSGAYRSHLATAMAAAK